MGAIGIGPRATVCYGLGFAVRVPGGLEHNVSLWSDNTFNLRLGGDLHRGGYPLINQGSDLLPSGLRGVWPTPRGLEEEVITLEGRAEGTWGREKGGRGLQSAARAQKLVVRK